jgi:hypothetical protein
MFVTECRAEFLGHQIVARNSWGLTFSLKGMTGENRLYIDGEIVDTNKEMIALASTPIMRGRIVDQQNNVHVVEVYARSGLIRVMLRIHIDGKKVAGEDF